MAGYLILCIENTSLPMTRFRHAMLGIEHRIVTAITATRGLELIESGNPDLILLDLDLSQGGRFELVRKIKRSEIAGDVPIILLTNGLDKEDLITARGLGVVDFVTRPYKMQMLEQKVARALKERPRSSRPGGGTQRIAPSRSQGRTTLIFRPGWLATIQDDVRSVLTATFLKQIQNDVLIFDLRALPDLSEDEVSVIDKLVLKISDAIGAPAEDRRILLLAGRHFGALVTFGDLETKAELFLTREELDVFINATRAG
ncbi:MAG: response regulator [Leptospirales bacterium]